MTDTTGNGSTAWGAPKAVPQRCSDDERAQWREVRDKTREVAIAEELTKAEVANRVGMPSSTFALWYDGTYSGLVGRQTRLVLRWLDSIEEGARFASPVPEPGFVKTPTAMEVLDRLVIAQTLPTIAVIVLGPGMGKTFAGQHYAKTHPHVTTITMRDTVGNTRDLLRVLAKKLDVKARSNTELDDMVGERLKRNGRQTLLIVDEAQGLTERALNELRYFKDEYGVGIALLGNADFKPADGQSALAAQIRRRIFIWLRRLTPLAGDIDAYVKAWRIEDKEVASLARAIGRRPGALGSIAETLKLAHIMAAADGRQLSADYLHQAWENRGDDALVPVRRLDSQDARDRAVAAA